MPLNSHKRDWEDLGKVDPLWAILSSPEKKFGNWNIDDFFVTGTIEIDKAMACAAKLGHPAGREVALDFGCGVGRLTRALARHFRHCHGVDISESMLARARELNASFSNSTVPHHREFSGESIRR